MLANPTFNGIRANFSIEKKEDLRVLGRKPWVEVSYVVNLSLESDPRLCCGGTGTCPQFRIQCVGQEFQSNSIIFQAKDEATASKILNFDPNTITMKQLQTLEKSGSLPSYEIPLQMSISNPNSLTFPIMNIYLMRRLMFKIGKQEKTLKSLLDSIEMGDISAKHDFIRVAGNLVVPKKNFLPGNIFLQHVVEFDIYIGSGDCMENPENALGHLNGKFNIVIKELSRNENETIHLPILPLVPLPPNYSQLSSRATSYETLPPNYEDLENQVEL